MNKKKYGTHKKYHYVYKTTNILNGRYYIGMHSTNNVDDGYLGSGTLLRRAINKYGKENFEFEILEYCNSREELSLKECEIVNLNEIAKKECMNLKVGGTGGFTVEQAKNGRKITDRKLREKYGEDFRRVVNKKYWDNLSSEDKKELSNKIKQAHKKIGFNYNTFGGRLHSDKTKSKIGKANSINQKGERNSQYGKPRSEQTKQRIREGLAKYYGKPIIDKQKLNDEKKLDKLEHTINGIYYTKKIRESISRIFNINLNGRCEQGLCELRESLSKLYNEEKQSTTQIARKLNTSSETIRCYLKRMGIARR